MISVLHMFMQDFQFSRLDFNRSKSKPKDLIAISKIIKKLNHTNTNPVDIFHLLNE